MRTEQIDPRYVDLDAWPTSEIIAAIYEGQLEAAVAVRNALGAITAAVEEAVPALERGGRLVYAGAGTSGRIGVQDGSELPPTFDWPPDRLVFAMAGGMEALIRSSEGAEDDEQAGAQIMVDAKVGSNDVVIGIAASGTTPFTLACMREAKQRGALTIGIANNRGTPLLEEADHPIFLDTGPEPIAGSTRMKAGTAQKIALNLLSTLLMISLGRVYDGLMVDVQAVNEKLVRRSEDMLVRLTDCGRPAARDALRRAQGSVKLAVMLLNGCDVEKGVRLIDRAGGRLRSALAAIPNRDSHAA